MLASTASSLLSLKLSWLGPRLDNDRYAGLQAFVGINSRSGVAEGVMLSVSGCIHCTSAEIVMRLLDPSTLPRGWVCTPHIPYSGQPEWWGSRWAGEPCPGSLYHTHKNHLAGVQTDWAGYNRCSSAKAGWLRMASYNPNIQSLLIARSKAPPTRERFLFLRRSSVISRCSLATASCSALAHVIHTVDIEWEAFFQYLPYHWDVAILSCT